MSVAPLTKASFVPWKQKPLSLNILLYIIVFIFSPFSYFLSY
jgi:hypothetical protein